MPRLTVDAPDTLDADGNTLDNITTTHYNADGTVRKTYGAQQNPIEYTYDYARRQHTMTTWQAFDESTGTGISGDANTTWTYSPDRGFLTRK